MVERKLLWPFAIQHAAEVQCRERDGEPDCLYEFAGLCLAMVKEPLDPWTERYKTVLFLGYAPYVTH